MRFAVGRQRLAHAARVQDITIRDLVFPEPERTRNILSAIINFIKFAEERGSFLKNLREQSTSAIEERDAMRTQVEEMRQKVADMKYAQFSWLVIRFCAYVTTSILRKQLEVDVPRVRENVCLIEAKPPRTLGEDVGGGEPGGDGGRLVCVGDIGGAARTAGLFDASPFTFFFPPPNERRNDHSPSNCMVSNSLDSGE